MTRTVRAGNLTAALVLIGFLDLGIGRIGNRLFASASAQGGAWSVIDALAPFLRHLCGVLGAGVLAVGLARLVRGRELLPPGMRISAAAIGATFLALAVWGVATAGLDERWFVHLHTSYGFVILLIGLSVLVSHVPWRVRAGVMLFILPGVLHATALFLDRANVMRDGALFITRLSLAGHATALVAAMASFALLPVVALRGRRLIVALTLATAAATALTFGVALHFDLMQSLARYGLGLELPSPPGAITFAYVGALFGFVLAAVNLLAVPGGSRLMGWGLLAFGLAGYQMGSAHELILAMVGILSLAVGAARAFPAPARAPVIASEAWRAFVGKLAGAADDGTAAEGQRPEAVVVHDDDVEVTRIRVVRAARPMSLRVRRRGGVVIEIEAQVGDPGRFAPTGACEARGNVFPRAWGARPSPRVETGDADFDKRFFCWGRVPFGDEALRLRLLEKTQGVLALHGARAVRYRAQPGHGAPVDHPFGAQLDPAPVLDLFDTLGAVFAAAEGAQAG